MKLKGIDVSEFNGTLNWKDLKSKGVSFAIIRSGYGVSYCDPQFAANVKGCEANGIPYGIYHFTYALNTDGVKKECDYVKSLIAKYCSKKPFCVAFDFEGDTVNYAKKQGVTLGKDAFNNHMLTWNKYFTGLGYSTPVYVNYSYYYNWYDKAKLGSYPLWIAYYQNECFVSNYALWQQTSSGQFSGYNCRFDINYADSSYVGQTTNTSAETASTSQITYRFAQDHQTWTNGSSPEPVYQCSDLKDVIGSLDPNEQCICYGRLGNAYLVCYKVNGTDKYKTGWVEYAGGVTY